SDVYPEPVNVCLSEHARLCGALCHKPFVSEHAQCETLLSPKGLPSCSDSIVRQKGRKSKSKCLLSHTPNCFSAAKFLRLGQQHLRSRRHTTGNTNNIYQNNIYQK